MDCRPRHPPARPVVLFVEAHEDTRMLYTFALSASGFDVVAAQDGVEGYRRASELHPDIILTDLPLPNDDGSQFREDLKHDARTRDIPVVAVNGWLQRSLRDHPERDGFAALFSKPCLLDELAARLREVLDGKFRGGATFAT